jgi:hypothetical protein
VIGHDDDGAGEGDAIEIRGGDFVLDACGSDEGLPEGVGGGVPDGVVVPRIDLIDLEPALEERAKELEGELEDGVGESAEVEERRARRDGVHGVAQSCG